MFKVPNRVLGISLTTAAFAFAIVACSDQPTAPVSNGSARAFDIVPQSSSYLIDTGPGPASGGGSAMFAYGSTHCSPNPPCNTYFQLLGGKVTLASNSHIESVEGWISAAWGGSVTAHVRTDSTTSTSLHIPGHSLGSASISIPSSATAWRVFSGLSIDVNQGTYWVTFEPDAIGGFDGGMPGPASSPLSDYGFFNEGNNRWVPFSVFSQNPGLGIRVFGSATASPGDLINTLRAYVAGANLPKPLPAKIDGSLQKALTALGANNTTAACTNLQDVIDLVNKQSVKKVPASVSSEIISQTNAIRTAIGC